MPRRAGDSLTRGILSYVGDVLKKDFAEWNAAGALPLTHARVARAVALGASWRFWLIMMTGAWITTGYDKTRFKNINQQVTPAFYT